MSHQAAPRCSGFRKAKPHVHAPFNVLFTRKSTELAAAICNHALESIPIDIDAGALKGPMDRAT